MIRTDKQLDKDYLIPNLQLQNEQLVYKLRKIEYKIDLTNVLTGGIDNSSQTTATAEKEIKL